MTAPFSPQNCLARKYIPSKERMAGVMKPMALTLSRTSRPARLPALIRK